MHVHDNIVNVTILSHISDNLRMLIIIKKYKLYKLHSSLKSPVLP